MKISETMHALTLCVLLAVLSTNEVRGQQQGVVADLAEQREALVTLYQSTGGESWSHKSGWLADTDVCSWDRVTCSDDGQGQVTELSLSLNNLVGTMPTELGNLKRLVTLHLWYNTLTNTIPTELGNLQSLTNLELDDNELAGTIPTELGNLQSLTNLVLDYNEVTGTIPTELGNLQSLVGLELGDNGLTGTIPTELGNLQSLVGALGLSFNGLSGTIPTELANLQSIESLELSVNELTGTIPTELGNLQSLVALFLSGNKLTGTIPTELGNLQSLDGLYLTDNKLTGTIPTELGNSQKFVGLILSSNELFGTIPTELGNVQTLYLANNGLTGTIPTELGNSQSLINIDLATNELTGTIPTELGNVRHSQSLFSLGLSNNRLTGSIPTELGNLQSINGLALQGNELTGTIPKELCSGNPLIQVDCSEVVCTCCKTDVGDECPSGYFGCFAGCSRVTVKNKGPITMDDLELGDAIMTTSGKYERVYAFGHRDCVHTAEFLQFQPSKLEMTSDHMIFVQNGKAVPAAAIKVGDILADGSAVTGIQHVARKGMYAPFTSSGTLVVNGVHVSSYVAFQGSEVLKIGCFSTGLSYQWMAHTFETLHRLWCQYIGSCLEERYNEDGISQWVEAPLNMAQWFLEQNNFVMLMLTIPLMMVFGVLLLVEIVALYPVVILPVVAALTVGKMTQFRVKNIA